MESQIVGRVAVAVTIENLYDLENSRQGVLPADFVVDPGPQRLIGNPAHGGEQVLELY